MEEEEALCPEQVRAFVDRPWDEVESMKRRYWAERCAAEGPAALFAAAAELYAHVKALHPDWPTEEDRAEDHRHHLRLKELLDRAAHAFAAG